MKARLLLNLLAAANCLALPCFAQWNDTADPRAAQLLVGFYDSALLTRYGEAFNQRNPAALAALFTEDAVLVTEEGFFSGRPEIEERYRAVFQRSHLTNFFAKRDQLNAIGNELWAVGRWWSLIQTGKGPVQVGGYWSEIYVREASEWKIRMSTFNTTPRQDLSTIRPILVASCSALSP
jgi:uncharacterized protein (TIGR02246 family)